MTKLYNKLIVCTATLLLTVPVFGAEVSIQDTQALIPLAEATTALVQPTKTFQVKPVVINGVSYVSVVDLENYMDVEWTYYKDSSGVSLNTPVSIIWLGERPQVNRRHLPIQGDKFKLIDDIIYVPARFVFENMNCKISYNSDTKYLTVDYFGIPKGPQPIEEQFNEIQGYVIDTNGKPAVNVEVELLIISADGSQFHTTDHLGIPSVVYTNEEGYYKFPALDTDKYPYVQISAGYEREVNGVVENFSGGIGTLFDYDERKYIDGFLRLPSKTVEMPIMYMYYSPW